LGEWNYCYYCKLLDRPPGRISQYIAIAGKRANLQSSQSNMAGSPGLANTQSPRQNKAGAADLASIVFVVFDLASI
jgi:hypothetical protein